MLLESQIKLELVTADTDEDVAMTAEDEDLMPLVVNVAVVKRMDVRVKKIQNSSIKGHLEAIKDMEASNANDPKIKTQEEKLDKSSLIHQEQDTSRDGDGARSTIKDRVGDGSPEECHSLSFKLEPDTNNNPDKSLEVEVDCESVVETFPTTSAVPTSLNSRTDSDYSSSASHNESSSQPPEYPQQQPRSGSSTSTASSTSSYPAFDRGSAVTEDVVEQSTFGHPYQTDNCKKMKKCRVNLKKVKVNGKSLTVNIIRFAKY